jgi:hypothetical protein
VSSDLALGGRERRQGRRTRRPVGVVLVRRLSAGLAGYVAVIALGIFLPVVAVLGSLVIAVYYLVPLRSRRQSH